MSQFEDSGLNDGVRAPSEATDPAGVSPSLRLAGREFRLPES